MLCLKMKERRTLQNDSHFNDFKAQKHFKGLDGIRCISIVSVMYFHFSGADERLGVLGVDLFFILSGFLITTLLLREREVNGSVNLRHFWIRRILRIFPIYYGFLLAQIIIFKFVSVEPTLVDEFYKNLPAFLTFTNNWFVHLSSETKVVFYHAWSLAAEEQFYLFWPPLLALTLCNKKLIAIPAALILFDIFITELIRNHFVDLGMNGNSIISSLQPAICLGVIAAVLLHYKSTFLKLHPILILPQLPSITALLAVVLIVVDVYHLLIHLVLMLFLVSVIFSRDKLMDAILNFKPVVYIGRISYGMYIFHMAVFNAVKMLIMPTLPGNGFAVISVTFVLTIFIALASYYLYEKPIMSLKHRLTS
jgi:peptidoglycan/LPS O-acetylase OafA/YrhL